jgi:hypothetical protein
MVFSVVLAAILRGAQERARTSEAVNLLERRRFSFAEAEVE